MRVFQCTLIFLFLVLSHSAVKFDFLEGFKLWDAKRRNFLGKLHYTKKCFTETKSTEIMAFINSHQCSETSLPLEDAIRIEYDNWLSEDWFPNDKELAEMKLDEVM
jgi:hypothetical protein